MDVKDNSYIHWIEQQCKSCPCYASIVHKFFTDLAGEDINDEAERIVDA